MIETKILSTTEENLKLAGNIIRDGGIVAFPTETVYGLGANGMNADSVKKIFVAKGRPSDNPLILHISDIEQLYDLAEEVTEECKKLIEAFWPGPLTVVVKAKKNIPVQTRGGLDTVGIRLPQNFVAQKIIENANVPIAAPSANLSGKPSPTKYNHVIDDMQGRIDAIVCGEDCKIGVESTVISVFDENITILRPGKISKKEIETVLGKMVALDRTLAGLESEISDFKPMSPGMKYRHYAPKAEMIVVAGVGQEVDKKIAALRLEYEKTGKKVGIMHFEYTDKNQAAHDLFDRLRQFDKEDVDIILATSIAGEGIGMAVMNRMVKAAGGKVVKV
ncbi:MAG: L-threonylcarbamoyladenylate synthase [Eubacteriales bacterium]|nr:L-threonylcarbamoyladenylate synthase [Eubacteriales bacterium]MDY3332485.1 L-threonylcarbamoyladenylate synthase [Gallibacter sp.]